MPEITVPEIRLPDVKLPEGLRDMSRKDIEAAINSRLPRKIELPEVDLSKVDLGKVDLSRLELPKAVEDRLPNRRRTNPLLPLAALAAIGSLVAAAWWLITSPTAMLRVRETADRIRSRINGTAYETDAEDRLETHLPDTNDQTRLSVENEAWPESFSDPSEPVTAGNGSAS